MMWDAIEMNLSVFVWGVGTGGLEAGKIGGGRVPEVGAGKSGRCRILKEGKWGENAQQCLIFRD